MQTREVLSIITLAALGVCLICGLAKMVMKSDKVKRGCDGACNLLVFVAVVLLGVGQLLGENKDGYDAGSKWGACLTRTGAPNCISYGPLGPWSSGPGGACDMTKPDGGKEDCWGDKSCCCAPPDYTNCPQ